MLTTTTHTHLQSHPWTQLVLYLFIITMCDYTKLPSCEGNLLAKNV